MFGKVGRCASENVIVELLKMKCLFVLFHGLEFCSLRKSQMKSLDFAINGAFSAEKNEIRVLGWNVTR